MRHIKWNRCNILHVLMYFIFLLQKIFQGEVCVYIYRMYQTWSANNCLLSAYDEDELDDMRLKRWQSLFSFSYLKLEGIICENRFFGKFGVKSIVLIRINFIQEWRTLYTLGYYYLYILGSLVKLDDKLIANAMR